MPTFTTKFITSEQLPLVVEPAQKETQLADLLELLDTKNDFFKESLLKFGGILLRNFPVKGENDFAAVIKALKTGDFLDYIGGDSPRTKIRDGVYTSTEAPPSIKIALHNELSFVKHFPTHIYFYCAIAPTTDGQTIIADARKIYQCIDPGVRERFINKGLKYVSCYHHSGGLINRIIKSHKSWVNVFETEDKREVEQKCRENDFEYKWNQNDWLQISQTRPAVITHPETNEPVWFNQAHLFDFSPKMFGWWRAAILKLLYCRKHTRLHQIFFADGTPIPRSDLYHILDVLDAHTIYFPWKKGDVLVLDNVLAMHGRATFKGPRRILTAMTGSGAAPAAHSCRQAAHNRVLQPV